MNYPFYTLYVFLSNNNPFYTLYKDYLKVCGVRRVFPESETALLRNKYETDTALADARRQAHAIAEQERKARGH
jgi:hypothetical protein